MTSQQRLELRGAQDLVLKTRGDGTQIARKSVEYNPVWADDLMEMMLSSSESEERMSSMDTEGRSSQDPLPLRSPMRRYPSSISPAVLLSMSNGSIYGGPCPLSRQNLHAHAQDFIELKGLDSKDQLDAFVRHELQRRAGELAARLRERKRAGAQNEKLLLRIAELENQRQMETKHLERWKNEQQKSRDK